MIYTITPVSEKKCVDAGVDAVASIPEDYSDIRFIPDDKDEFVDPRLKDCPIPLVAKTVDLYNNPTEPILTFCYWILATFWVIIGCGITSFYYFEPYFMSLSTYAVQLLSWEMGSTMAAYLLKLPIITMGYSWSLNVGPWTTKEHALIVV
ncbi:hypothetical protein DL98DRAFT_587995 [Cadophora sp. DSE1049]|nr:hypothetical protein DL98DRAFT_587995 [Cadophora sp. DSE1049]